MEEISEGMKMLEEGENQPKIKFEEDGISALPDFLLLEILSRLPNTKYAIRTGTLSKRWEHLWTLVPTLIFSDSDLPPTQSNYALLVDKTLTQCRQLKLKKFQVRTFYDIRFESQFNNWIRYAIRCNVKELDLRLCKLEFGNECMMLDQIVFTSSCIIDLRLYGCMVNPIGAISWKNLRYLCISETCINEDLIENILSGSPVLETLELNYCYGYRRIDISSKSVKNLVFSDYWNPHDELLSASEDIIEIIAPDILALTIYGVIVLKKLLLLNVASLVNVELSYNCTRSVHGSIQVDDEMLKGHIMNLGHVKELKIGTLCYEAASQLQARGFIFPSNVKFHMSEETHE